jgi:hypothetical protein
MSIFYACFSLGSRAVDLHLKSDHPDGLIMAQVLFFFLDFISFPAAGQHSINRQMAVIRDAVGAHA